MSESLRAFRGEPGGIKAWKVGRPLASARSRRSAPMSSREDIHKDVRWSGQIHRALRARHAITWMVVRRSGIPRGRRDRDLSYRGPLGAIRSGCGESNLRLVTAMGRGKGQIGLTIDTEGDRVDPQGQQGIRNRERTVSRARRMRACANDLDEARVSGSSV